MQNRIREAREKANLTQVALAKMVNVTQGAVTQWERGATMPKLPTLMKLSSALNVSIECLLGREKSA